MVRLRVGHGCRAGANKQQSAGAVCAEAPLAFTASGSRLSAQRKHNRDEINNIRLTD